MTKTALGALIAVSILAATLAHAAETFDPAARAKTIAPLVEEETMGMVHVDLARIDVDASFDQYLKTLLIPEGTVADGRREFKAFVDGCQDVGVQEVYFVLAPIAFETREVNIVFAGVPLTPECDENAVRDVLEKKMAGSGERTVQRIGDLLVVGSHATVARLAKAKPDNRPELEKAFAAAGDTAVQILVLPPRYSARAFAEMMPELSPVFGGGPSSVVTQGCLWAAVGIDLPPKMGFRAVIQSADHAAAEALAAKWGPIGKWIDHRKHICRILPEAEKAWESLAPRVDGDRLVWRLDEQKIAAIVTRLTPPVRAVREDAMRACSINNLKQIGLAMHTWHIAHNAFPPAASRDKDGKPLLSWRVHILPYIEEEKLYREFHLDEPWDSPHNKKLIGRMPMVYRDPAGRAAKGATRYQVPVGPGTLFEGKQGRSIRDVTDGTTNTIMTVETDAAHAVPWTKPDDWHCDLEKPTAGLVDGDSTVRIGMADGCVRNFQADTIAPELFKGVLTISGGEPVNEFFRH
ncbi:MAG: DUF1559 domain-containing protein [Pirellulales bacterium]|nr:DUF1559 domain-containing protein [Pirellulales bacterium]